jgi:tetratricopeptide (TPR) repeat protein
MKTMDEENLDLLHYYIYTLTPFIAKTMQEKVKNYESVINALQSDDQLRVSSAHARALILLGSVYCDAGQFDEALKSKDDAFCVFTEGLELPELHAKAHGMAAEAYEGLGRLTEAVEALRQRIACDPSFASKISKEIERLNEKV